MDRIDSLIMKAKNRLEPPAKPWERLMRSNPYTNQKEESLLELLSEPRSDWRQIVQAMAWKKGG